MSAKFISFGSSSSTKPTALPRPADRIENPTHHVKSEPEMKKMICFQGTDLSAATSSSTASSSPFPFVQLKQYCHGSFGSLSYDVPAVKNNTRTPLQARSHVISERNRRLKMAKRFRSLSALVPGLQQLNKASVIDGAINHIKQLEKRLKALEDEAGTTSTTTTKVQRDEESSSVSTARKRYCRCYDYEEDYPPLKKMEVKIFQGDVVITADCKNQTGFREEEFVSEMEKLHLTLTNIKLMAFGDNMVALAAVAKMKEGLCMKDEELADNICMAILKIIGMKKNYMLTPHSED